MVDRGLQGRVAATSEGRRRKRQKCYKNIDAGDKFLCFFKGGLTHENSQTVLCKKRKEQRRGRESKKKRRRYNEKRRESNKEEREQRRGERTEKRRRDGGQEKEIK